MYALKKYGIDVKDRSELYKFVGPPLHGSFQNYYGFTKEEADKAVEYYREYYRDKGIFENLLYDGMEVFLKKLHDSGRTLILATSKPTVFAKQILESFDIAKYFTYIVGSNLDGTMVKKDEIIKCAIKSCGIIDLSKVVMVGDREHDIIGAKKAGVGSIGVLYGYGNRNELENAGADFIADTVDDIWNILSI
jgi:phosphoglycolate phosphatase